MEGIWKHRVPMDVFIFFWDHSCYDLCHCCRVPVRKIIDSYSYLFLFGITMLGLLDIQVLGTCETNYMNKWLHFKGNSREK